MVKCSHIVFLMILHKFTPEEHKDCRICLQESQEIYADMQ